MSELLCIGGPKDGERIEIKDGERTVNVYVARSFATGFDFPRNAVEIPPPFVYQRNMFHAEGKFFDYLAPADMPPHKQIAKLMDGYHPL